MNSQLNQLLVQMPMLEDVNVLIQLRDFKPTLFGWEMSKDVSQFFIQQAGVEHFQLFWPQIVMLKTNLVGLKE